MQEGLNLMKKIPCTFLPSQVMIIDDDQSIVENLIPCLDEDTSTYIPCQNPFQALEMINAHQENTLFSHQLVEQTNPDAWQHVRLDFNIYDLYKEVYNPNRFKQLSTIIVDYHMPGITGIELCSKINNPWIQRILLTGDEDEHIAIDAFNQGLIQAYIKKHEFESIKKLKKAIVEAQLTYFQQTSSLITTAATFDKSTTALEDPAFIELFFKLVEENNIVEYYLHETTGTFLLLNKKGEASSLFTFLQDHLDAITSSHELFDPLFDEMQAHKKMLCFHNHATIEIPDPSNWYQYVRPAQQLQGNQLYYYAYGPGGFDLDNKQILSFENFCRAA